VGFNCFSLFLVLFFLVLEMGGKVMGGMGKGVSRDFFYNRLSFVLGFTTIMASAWVSRFRSFKCTRYSPHVSYPFSNT